ncbi:MAG: 50S ribosomal protein L21 [Bacteroidia bacterium]|nr:50S ribosomal protein L21 [Bacteroidia bacterium]
MYAIVEIAGLQYKVAKKQRVFVHRLEANEGENVEFSKVLLIDNDGKITVGAPVVDGARVAAKVLSHMKGDKVLVFKKKRRKGYQKLNGHRQQMTELLIQAVLGKGEKLSAEDAKLEVASTLELKRRSAAKSAKKVYAVTEKEEEEVVEEKPKKAAKKAPAKKAAAKKTATKKKKED